MFNTETVAFLCDLKANNTRDWFAANKPRYETAMKRPAKTFADALAAKLGETYQTDARAKVFRVNRDLRFAKDKTPYNAHIHIAVGDGMTGNAWMFGLEPDRLVLGYGNFGFTKSALEAYRKAVAADGDMLAAAVRDFRLDMPELKRVPSPHPQDHPHGQLLRRKGLCAWIDTVPLETSFHDQAVDKIAAELSRLDALRAWFMLHLD